MTVPEQTPDSEVRAGSLLKVRTVWVVPMILTSVLIVAVTLSYFGAIVDPTSHLHDLPVSIVNEDQGGLAPTGRINLGQQVAAALSGSPAVNTRLSLHPVTLAEAHTRLNRGADYATIVIPAGFTDSVLRLGGTATAAPANTTPTIDVLTNSRAGTLGVGLATGVLQPALNAVSGRIGQQVLSAAGNSVDPRLKAFLADPVTVATVPYRPLPSHSGLGLSAFYVALLSIMCGFLGATIVNAFVDSALGYATSEIGPWWRQRLPARITRWQTLLAKWIMALAVVPVLTALLLLMAAGVLRMNAPHLGLLWIFISFAAIVTAIGTLALFAVLGTLGQVVALIIFVYLALASSGGTVPLQALSGFYRFVANFEPLRQVLDGVRAILYFNAQADAGLTRAFVLTGIGLVFWVLIGFGIASWYDRRGLHRLQPEVLAYVHQSVATYAEQGKDPAPDQP
jgi:YhgE/Pip-like protein